MMLSLNKAVGDKRLIPGAQLADFVKFQKLLKSHYFSQAFNIR